MRISTTLPILIALLAACRGTDGEIGPAGPVGPQGEQGEQGDQGLAGTDGEDGEDAVSYLIEGTVSDGSGLVGEGFLVVVDLVDDSGSSVANLGVTMTDATGGWSIIVNEGLSLHPRLVASALVDDMLYQAPVTDFAATALDPVSTAALDIVLLITETDGGASLDHYTPTELADILSQADANVTTAGTDRTDFDAVWDEVLDSTGSLIASYAETDNEIGVAPIAWGADLPLCAAGDDCVTNGPTIWSAWDDGYFTTEVGSGYLHELNDSGDYISDAFNANYDDAYDDALYFYVDGDYYGDSGGGEMWIEDAPNEPNIATDDFDEDSFDYWPAADRGATTELVFTDDTDSVTDFTLSRRFWFDPVGGWVRTTEIVTYTGSAATTVDIDFYSEMGSDSDTTTEATSSGDTTVDGADTWLLNSDDDSGDPLSAFWFGTVDWAEYETSDYYYWGWDGVAFEPGQTRTFIAFTNLWDYGSDMAAAAAALDGVQDNMDLFAGMSPEHVDAAYNIDIASVAWTGEAGTVAPWADVTVTNDTTSESWSSTADSDGSFSIGIAGTTGDALSLVGSDGTTLATTFP